jgi:GNAT superfamily N-acetyltransferase
MHPELNALCTRLEFAQASQNLACAHSGGGETLRLPGALGVYLGAGHPFNQGLALGLRAPLPAADLDRLEAFLGRGGAPVVLELTPGADPDLPALLAARGYRIRQFQQVWARGPEPLRDPGGCEVRPVTAAQADLAARVVQAGFLDCDDLAAQEPGPALSMATAEATTVFLAWVDGRPAAAGAVGLHGDVAALSGTSVLPRYRGRGLQRALIAARLAFARDRGCTLAASATLPGGASQANLERCGFKVVYPKLEMVRDPVP